MEYYNKLITVIVTCLLVTSSIQIISYESLKRRMCEENEKQLEDIKVLTTLVLHLTEEKYLLVKATKYNADPKQCNEDYLRTASMTLIDTNKLRTYELNYVALSRDLYKHYNFHDTIKVISRNPNLSKDWVVKDKMNKRYEGRIDFLLPKGDTTGFDKPEDVLIKTK